MQISRHWRLNPQRYRLEGVLYRGIEGTFVSLQSRPLTSEQVDKEIQAQKAKQNIIEFGNTGNPEAQVLPKRKAV